MSSVLPFALLGLPFLLGGGGGSPSPDPGPLNGGGGTSGGGGEPPKPISIADGQEWAKSLPKSHGPARESAIFAAVKAGGANLTWTSIRTQAGPYTATLLVLARALRIGKSNPIRVEMDYVTHQKICDLLGASMMTPFISDQLWKQAKIRIPYNQKPDWQKAGTMATTENMVVYSRELDQGSEKLGRAPIPIYTDDKTIVANECKDWVIAKRLWSDNISPEKSWQPKTMDTPEECWSANYGWYQANSVPVQSVGKAHNMVHSDYSQEYRAVHNIVIVEGPVPLGAVHYVSLLRHPTLHQLVSNEGMLPDCKHPFFGTTVAPILPPDIIV